MADCKTPLTGAGEVDELTQRFELHVQDTVASQGKDVVVLKQGYLLMRSTGVIDRWRRRYFVLDSAGMLCHASSHEVPYPTALSADHVRRIVAS